MNTISLAGLVCLALADTGCLEPAASYRDSPQALNGILMLEAAAFGLSIEKSLLELIKICVSQLNQCSFCTDMHAVELGSVGAGVS